MGVKRVEGVEKKAGGLARKKEEGKEGSMGGSSARVRREWGGPEVDRKRQRDERRCSRGRWGGRKGSEKERK